ncbi:MAG: site-2 protease family protein, partial [Methanophagales archaeon]|nr:site-2 protease family protein [Methanophagales archaeon]
MDSHYLTLVLYVFLIYWFIVLVLDRKGILQRYDISAFGPILMIRTKRGQRLLERLAKGELRERFWRTYANIGTILVLIAMTFMFILVLLGVYATFTVQPEPTELHAPRNWLLIPGLNEFIPLCAWVGLAVALVVHELSHAVLSTVEKIKVKSMGLLVALIPIGAFAEPDSEQLFGEKEKGKKTVEERELEPEPDKEPKAVKEEKKKVATARERTRILSAGVTSNFFVAFIAFLLFFSILFAIQPVSEGVGIVGVEKGFPAANTGIKEGMSIIRMDNEPIRDYRDFFAFMNSTTPGQVVEVQTIDEKFIVRLEKSPYDDIGFLGVTPFPTKKYLEYLRGMPSSLASLSISGWLWLTLLPFLPLPA